MKLWNSYQSKPGLKCEFLWKSASVALSFWPDSKMQMIPTLDMCEKSNNPLFLRENYHCTIYLIMLISMICVKHTWNKKSVKRFAICLYLTLGPS